MRVCMKLDYYNKLWRLSDLQPNHYNAFNIYFAALYSPQTASNLDDVKDSVQASSRATEKQLYIVQSEISKRFFKVKALELERGSALKCLFCNWSRTPIESKRIDFNINNANLSQLKETTASSKLTMPMTIKLYFVLEEYRHVSELFTLLSWSNLKSTEQRKMISHSLKF